MPYDYLYKFLLAICLVKGMLLKDGAEDLDHLLQKSLCYEHHLKNYKESLKTGLIPNGLRIKKSAAITPVTEDFHRKWQQISYLAEIILYNCCCTSQAKLLQKSKLI